MGLAPGKKVTRFAGNDQAATIEKIGKSWLAYFSKKFPYRAGKNQDSMGLKRMGTSGMVLAVADGAGGMPSGARVSKVAIEKFFSSLRGGGKDSRNKILDGIENSNAAILKTRTGGATTFVAAEIRDKTARCFHAGDSNCLIFNSRGRLKFRNTAHSFVGSALAAGKLSPTEAENHPEANIVNNLMGLKEMRIEIGPVIPLSKGDTVFVASDGLLESVSYNFLQKASSMKFEAMIECLDQEIARLAEESSVGSPLIVDDLTYAVFRR